MDSIYIVATYPVGEEGLRKIRAVSPQIKIDDASGLCTFVNGKVVEKQDEFSRDKFRTMLEQVEVFYGSVPPANLITRAPNLKWIQSAHAGVDRFLVPEIIASSVVLTSSQGIHGIQVSEVALEMLLMLAKKAPVFFRLKLERKYQRAVPGILYSRTLGILGLGNIGREVARLGKAFGMRVVALEIRELENADNVDAIYSPENIKEFLSICDYAVITLPLTPGTRHIIGEAELKAMKPTAYLVNVARGAIVDEEALIQALDENRIAGAGLDVFATEPLPPDSRLWDLPNLIISPHIAGDREDYASLAVDLFCENLKRYLQGKRLLNVINKQAGF